nr:MAG TPA: hypothetical protein [Caudoviricetes sp.]
MENDKITDVSVYIAALQQPLSLHGMRGIQRTGLRPMKFINL